MADPFPSSALRATAPPFTPSGAASFHVPATSTHAPPPPPPPTTPSPAQPLAAQSAQQAPLAQRLPRGKSAANVKKLQRGQSFTGPRASAQEGYRARQAAKSFVRKRYAQQQQADGGSGGSGGSGGGGGGGGSGSPTSGGEGREGKGVLSLDDRGVGVVVPEITDGRRGMGPRRGSRRMSARARHAQKGKENLSDEAALDADLHAYVAEGKGDNDGARPLSRRGSRRINKMSEKTPPPSEPVVPTTHEPSRDRSEGVQAPRSSTPPPTTEPTATVTATPRREPTSGASRMRKNSLSPTMSSVSEACTEDDSSGYSPPARKPLHNIRIAPVSDVIEAPKLSSARVVSCELDIATTGDAVRPTAAKTEKRRVAEPHTGQADHVACQTKVPSSGKWCNECAGVGLHIAALLSEFELQRAGADGMSGDSTSVPSSSSKKGWKSMVTQTVLGESKSKSSSEKARLNQEIDVLRATVEFLYKKIDTLEGRSSTDASESPSM